MIKDIQEELETLSARRAELQSELLRGDVEVSSARECLLQGTVGAVQSVTLAHSSAEALRAAVNALDERIKQKQIELTTALDDARRESEFDKLLQVARQAEERYKEYIAVRSRMNQTLTEMAIAQQTAFESLLTTRQEWVELVDKKLYRELDVARLESNGVDLTGAQICWSGSRKTKHDITVEHPLPHVYPFGNILPVIYQLWVQALEEQEQKTKQAA